MRPIAFLFFVSAMCACGEGPASRDASSPGGSQEPDAPVSVGPDPWQAARTRGIEFRALGQEPGWYLEIDEGKSMHLVYDYAEREATLPVPTPVVAGDTTTYDAKTEAHHLRVVIEDSPCSDSMSGLRFPRAVTVTIDGSTYKGCGQEL